MTYRASAYFPGERDEEEFFAWRRASLVVVGHDVWIGHGAIILAGRTVGTGAVVGAGAVVTKDIDPYAIVAGNPARVIRQRFSAAVAHRLQRLAWWDWDHDRLRAALPDFRQLSIEAFLEKYELTSVQRGSKAYQPQRDASQTSRSKTRQARDRTEQTARS
jgi:phosphonate metabolism protein (transferase hexapeptide repeat family)